MRSLLQVLLVSAALTGFSFEARAAAVIYTFTGSVSDGFDASGVFGVAGRNLAGQAFTARFERDDAVPGAVQVYSPGASRIVGTGSSSPLPVATLTIDGQTHSFGTRDGRQHQSSVPCGGCTDDAFGFSADDRFEGFLPSSSLLRSMFKELVFDGAGSNILASADYHSLTGFGPGDGADMSGSFYVFDEISKNVITGVFPTSIIVTKKVVSLQEAYGFFEIESLTVTGLGAAGVPEPSTWALSILGFGGVGAMIRRRRPTLAWSYRRFP